MSKVSTKTYDTCTSGESCLNPEPHLSPTNLKSEDSVSQSTGVCSYCRKAWRSGGEPPRNATPLSAIGVIEVPDDSRLTTAAFDPSEYDSFNPEVWDQSKKVSPLVKSERDADALAAHEEEDSLNDTMGTVSSYGAMARKAVISKKLDSLTDSSSERTPVGTSTGSSTGSPLEPETGGKDELSLHLLGEAAAADDVPVDEPEEPALPLKSKKEGPAPASEKRGPQVKGRRGRPAKKESSDPKGTVQEIARESQAEPSLPSPVPPAAQATSVVPPAGDEQAKSPAEAKSPAVAHGESQGAFKTLSARIGRVWQRLPSEEVSFDLASAAVVPKKAQPAGLGDEESLSDYTSRLGTTFTARRRLAVGLKETGRGLYALCTSIGRMTVGGFGLLAMVVLGTLVQLPVHLIKFNPVRLVSVVITAVREFLGVLDYCLAPLFDGRFVPAASVLTVLSGVIMTPHVAPAVGVAVIATGMASGVGYVVWRGVRGFVTGRTLDFARRKWMRNWTDTSGMDSKQIKNFNDEFERTVAAAFRELGFKAIVNGTQRARANGHVGSGDGGVDVFLVDSHNTTTIISCKRYSDPVDVKEVRDIFAVAQSHKHSGAKAMLVTTVGFTKPAIDFARENGIALVKIDDLIKRATKLMV